MLPSTIVEMFSQVWVFTQTSYSPGRLIFQPGRFVLGVAGVDLGDQETNDSARDLSKPAATNKVKIALKSRSMQGRP